MIVTIIIAFFTGCAGGLAMGGDSNATQTAATGTPTSPDVAEPSSLETPSAQKSTAEPGRRSTATPSKRKTSAKPTKKPTKRKQTQAPAATDPRFDTCAAANRAGYGPYVRGIDPEYAWYEDRDGDGVVCER